MRGRRNRQRKEMAKAHRRRGFGDDLFYRMVERHTVKVGDVLETDVFETDADGNGVVRIGKLMIKIPDYKIGSRVKLKIVEIRGRNAKAEIIEEE